MRRGKVRIKVFVRTDSIDTEGLKTFCSTDFGDCNIEYDGEPGVPVPDSSCYNAVVSDDIELLRKLKTSDEGLSVDDTCIGTFYKVYVGDTDGIEPDEVDDFWPASESPSFREMRFNRLIRKTVWYYSLHMYQAVLKTVIDSVPDLVWLKDMKGAHMLVNDEFSRTAHKTKEDIYGRGHYYIWDITPEEYSSGEYVCMESEEETMKAGKTCVFDEPLKTSEGMKQLKTYKTPVYDPFGNMYGTVGFAHDVTNFTNMGLELDILVENIPVPLILCDINMKTIKVNDSLRELVGISKGETVDYSEWKSRLTPVNKKGRAYKRSSVREYTYDRAGQIYSLIVTEHPIVDYFGNTTGYFILINDISFERKYEESMLEAAYTDGLTGLFNRRFFYEYIKDCASEEMTLLYMDLDRFKFINDNYGHARGDEVLIKTADIIRNAFPGAINARLGGDEFATIIKGNADDELIESRCREIDENIRSLVRSNGPGLTISIGIARTSGTDNVDEFIHEGDSRMYEIKKAHHEEADRFMAEYDPDRSGEDRKRR